MRSIIESHSHNVLFGEA